MRTNSFSEPSTTSTLYSVCFVWFDTIICLSNLSCELWNKKLKIKEIYFFKNLPHWRSQCFIIVDQCKRGAGRLLRLSIHLCEEEPRALLQFPEIVEWVRVCLRISFVRFFSVRFFWSSSSSLQSSLRISTLTNSIKIVQIAETFSVSSFLI